MNRITKRFNKLKESNEKAFITYMMAGYPSLEKTKEYIIEQEKAGVDILEIGVPFSDPLADGPVIQDVGYKALQNGVNLKKVLNLVETTRKETEIPLILMLYSNTVINYGMEKFVNDCIKVGVDGIIIPDLPFEEQNQLSRLITTDDLILIQLVAPTSIKRLPKLLNEAKGFIYCVSSLGVTGQNHDFHGHLLDFLQEVKSNTTLPVMLGFGITKPEDVRSFSNIIDGAIVGSAFIKQLMKTDDTNKVIKWCKNFKEGINNI